MENSQNPSNADQITSAIDSAQPAQNTSGINQNGNARKGKKKIFIGLGIIITVIIFGLVARIIMLNLGIVNVDDNYVRKLNPIPTDTDKNLPQATKPTTAISPTASHNAYMNDQDKETVKQLISQKTNIPLDKIALTYDPEGKFGADYATGTVSEQGVAGGGGRWFAAKQNGAWVIVWTGNGLPKCIDTAQYNLPQGFLTCY